MKCPVCFGNIADHATNCEHCGNPVRKTVGFCSNCGQNTKEHWANCKYCGNPLIPANEQAAPPKSAAEPASEPAAAPKKPAEPPQGTGFTQEPPKPGVGGTTQNTQHKTENCKHNFYSSTSTFGGAEHKHSDILQDIFGPNFKYRFSEDSLGSSDPAVLFSRNSRLMAIILAVVFGTLGVHNFYLGNISKGVAQLVIRIFSGWFFGLGILITLCWALHDAYLLITHKTNFNYYGQELR